MKELKLTVELIPQPCWYINMRTKHPDLWRGIQRDTHYKAGGRCQICGEVPEEKLHCHEIWEYDNKKHVQTLVDVMALCYMCHSIKHIGFAFTRMWAEDDNPRKIENRLIRHFTKINKCGRGVFVTHVKEEFAKYEERNRHQWTTVMDKFLPQKKSTFKPRRVFIDGRQYGGYQPEGDRLNPDDPPKGGSGVPKSEGR